MEMTTPTLFQKFLETRPDLEDLGKRLGIDHHTSPSLFVIAAHLALMDEEAPSNYQAQPPAMATLSQQLRDPSLPDEERRRIEGELLALADQAHDEALARVEADEALANRIDMDFEKWAKSPEGVEANAILRAEENARENERLARMHQLQMERFQKICAEARERLTHHIGKELCARLDPSHPDCDWGAAKQILRHKMKTNLLAYGPPGLAKTRSLAALALRLAGNGWDVVWCTGTEFAEAVTSTGPTASNSERTSALQKLDALATSEALILDDLGSAGFTEARTAHLFQILDTRYRNGLPTAVSTNCGSEELRRLIAGGSRDPQAKLVADRLLRRLTGSPADPRCVFVRFKPKGQKR